jgi:predicted Fe-S protein YdhL (DUF1289 family)
MPLPMSTPSQPVSSPCNGICRIDTDSGLCEGCARSMDEIATWGSSSEERREEILRLVHERMGARLRVQVRRGRSGAD